MKTEFLELKKEGFDQNRPLKIALIHHTDPDGYMCGYLFSQIYSEYIKQGIAELIPYNYTKYESWMTDESFTNFIFADVTPPIDWFEAYYKEIEEKQFEVCIFDHHQARYDKIYEKCSELIDSGIIEYHFMSESSGSEILYQGNICENIRNERLFVLIKFINDYDIWKFDSEEYEGIYTDIRTFYAADVLALNMYLMQFDSLKKFKQGLSNLFENDTDKMYYFLQFLREYIQYGHVIVSKLKNDIEHRVKAGYYSELNKCMFLSGYPEYWTLEQIKKKYPEVLYWIGFEINLKKQSVKFSIRSKEKFDCSKIAERYNGGGHPQASGFTVDLDQGLKILAYPDIIFSEIDHSIFRRPIKNL